MLGFSPLICEYQGWAQGGLGMLVMAAALIFAVALMVYLRWTGGIPYVILGALAMYYGVPIIEDMFGWNQNCAVVRTQFAQQEQDMANTRICENNLFNADAQTGEDCSCNGESSTPSCISYYSACEENIANSQTSGNICSCAFADSTEVATPACYAVPEGGRASVFLTNQQACSVTLNNQECESPYAADFHNADYLVPNTSLNSSNQSYLNEQTEIDNPTSHPITVTWYSQTDDTGWFFLNGQQVGYNPDSDYYDVKEMTVTLQPGVNTLTVTSYHGQSSYFSGYPTGTIDSIVGQSGTVYSTSGPSWYEVKDPPVSPNPPPSGPIVNCYTQSCAG